MSKPPPGTSGPVDEIHWPSLIAALASITAVGIAIGLGLPLLSVIMEKRGIAPTLNGLNAAMAGLASMAAAPFTMKFAHRHGVAPTMLLAIMFAAASSLGFYYLTNFWLWFPLRIVFHGAITVLFILSEFWINATAPPNRRGFVLGIYGTVLSLGFASGPLLFSILGSEGFLPFAVGAGVILLSAIRSFSRAMKARCWRKAEAPFHALCLPGADRDGRRLYLRRSGIWRAFPVSHLRDPRGFQRIAGSAAADGHGRRQFHLPDPPRHASDRVKDRRTILSALTLIGLVGALFLPTLVENWFLMALVLLFWGGCVSGLYTVGLSHLGSRLQGADLAAANAAFVFSYAVGTVAGPQVIGAAMDVTGNDGFAWAIAGFFGLYVVLSLVRIVLKPKRP